MSYGSQRLLFLDLSNFLTLACEQAVIFVVIIIDVARAAKPRVTRLAPRQLVTRRSCHIDYNNENESLLAGYFKVSYMYLEVHNKAVPACTCKLALRNKDLHIVSQELVRVACNQGDDGKAAKKEDSLSFFFLSISPHTLPS